MPGPGGVQAIVEDKNMVHEPSLKSPFSIPTLRRPDYFAGETKLTAGC